MPHVQPITDKGSRTAVWDRDESRFAPWHSSGVHPPRTTCCSIPEQNHFSVNQGLGHGYWVGEQQLLPHCHLPLQSSRSVMFPPWAGDSSPLISPKSSLWFLVGHGCNACRRIWNSVTQLFAKPRLPTSLLPLFPSVDHRGSLRLTFVSSRWLQI